jgi:hypothetical protein
VIPVVNLRAGVTQTARGSGRLVMIVVVLSALIASAGLRTTARADAKIALGGGAGISVDGSYCTLTTIGHDNTGELVGFTAAHCGGPGAQVVAEGAEDRGTAGTVATTNDYLDYAVITFDPTKVTPIANFAGFAINGIGPDPAPDQPVCKQGGATGNDCGYIRPFLDSRPDRPAARIAASWQPGDDGTPVTSDGLLVAMIHNGFILPATGPFIIGHPEQSENRVIYISAILDDANGGGGPGAGFTPIAP